MLHAQMPLEELATELPLPTLGTPDESLRLDSLQETAHHLRMDQAEKRISKSKKLCVFTSNSNLVKYLPLFLF